MKWGSDLNWVVSMEAQQTLSMTWHGVGGGRGRGEVGTAEYSRHGKLGENYKEKENRSVLLWMDTLRVVDQTQKARIPS